MNNSKLASIYSARIDASEIYIEYSI